MKKVSIGDAGGNASPQDAHVHPHEKQEHCCGADARLSVSHVSLPYGRLLLLTFEMFFLSPSPLPFIPVCFTHTRTHLPLPPHLLPAATQYFVIKRHCISSRDQADGAA